MSKYTRWGRPVTDAKAPISVRVIEKDIKGAVCRDHQRCVIANAIKRSKKCDFIDVGASTVIIGTQDGKATRFKLDALGRQVVRYFDLNEGRAAPTQIVLRPPSVHEKLGARKGEAHGSKKRSGRRAAPTR